MNVNYICDNGSIYSNQILKSNCLFITIQHENIEIIKNYL